MRTLLPFCLGPHNERKIVPWAKRGGRQPYAMYIYMYIYACMYDSNSIDTPHDRDGYGAGDPLYMGHTYADGLLAFPGFKLNTN